MKPFEPSTYLKEVLGKARAAGRLPDFFERYQLDYTDDDDEAIKARRAEVKAQWDKWKERDPRYGPMIMTLLGQHSPEAEMALLDRAERARHAERLSQETREHEAADRRKREEWERAVDQVVKREGGLSPGMRAQFEEAARHAGIPAEVVQRRLDTAPSITAPEMIEEGLRQRIARALSTLAQAQGQPSLGLSLFHALEIEITTDQNLIESRYRERYGVNSRRAHGHLQACWGEVLGHAQTALIKADPRAYLEGLIVDISARLKPQALSAVANDGEIDETEAEHLTREAIAAGLTPELAARVVGEITRDMGTWLRTGAKVDYVLCAWCRTPHDRTRGQERCQSCGQALYLQCPADGCGERNDADAARCSKCGKDLHRYADARRNLGKIEEQLRAGRLAEARLLVEEAERVIGSKDPEVAVAAEQVRARTAESEALWREVDEALPARRLYAARRSLAPLRRIAADAQGAEGLGPKELLRRVEEGISEAEQKLAAARSAAPAEREERLAEVLKIAADSSEARAELDGIPPELPGEVVMRSDAGRVAIQWRPSRSPGAEYEVTRLTGSGSADAIGRFSQAHCEDADAGAGESVRYRVVAVRGAARSSPCESAPGLVIREVSDASAAPGDGEVRLSWAPPRGSGRVVVTRSDDRGAEVQITADGGGAVDRNVRNGDRYAYRVQVEYPTEGPPIQSPGVTVYAQPAERPRPLGDLAVHSAPGGVTVDYASLSAGRVTIVACSQEPTLEAGAELDPAEIQSLGRVLGERGKGAVDGSPERMTWYLPITVAGGMAVVGHAVRHVGLPPIEGVKAEEATRVVRVTWEWPDRVKMARVAWRRDRQPSGPDDPDAKVAPCRLGEYRDNGGFTIDPGKPGPIFVAVYPALRVEGEMIVGSLATKRSRATVRSEVKTEVRYEVRQSGFRKKRLTVTISEPADPSGLPRMVLVGKRGEILPHGPRDGEALTAVGGGAPAEATVELPGDRPLAVRLFVEASADASSFAIFHPTTDMLVIGR